ncbi:MAG: type transport system ATP-binding protein [Chloroflexota bacterium]|nr:type transport system ATP-binding protein [Chloroflexota bacterium]
MIEAHGLTKHFGAKPAVADMSFEVGEGQIHGLLGPNGAGKTTTTRMLACLLTPDSGEGRVAGFDIATEPAKVRESIGILTEVPGLYERLNAFEYLDFFGEMHGLARAKRRARVEGLMRLLGVWEMRNQRLRSFSKGMKQKVAIARTLIHEPRVLFFDEPTAALDPEAAKTVRDHLVQLIEQERCTVLLCTHNLAEAERICSRLTIVQNGRSVAEGTPAELKAQMGRAVQLTLRTVLPQYVDLVRDVPGVESVNTLNGSIAYQTADEASVNPVVVRRLVEAGGDVVRLQTEVVGLEDAYLHFMRKVAAESPAHGEG